jgi:UDP-glucose 4-epimerase
MQSPATNAFFNVGTGRATTINELVQLFLRVNGSNMRPEYRTQEESFVTNRLGSTEKAWRLLGFRAALPLADGLRSAVE